MKFLYRHSEAICASGKHVKDYLLSLGVKQEKIFVAPNVVDNNLFNRYVSYDEIKGLKIQLGLDEEKIILYVGRLAKEKGLDYFLRAFKDLNRPDLKLILIGEGYQRNYLEELVRNEKINNVIFLGYIPNEELYRYYALADVLVLPSVETKDAKEGWGIVINEAMNQGLPIVATKDVGAAAAGLIHDGINGFVIPARDTEALQKAIEKLFSVPGLRESMGKSSKDIVRHWTQEKMLAGFREAIDYVKKI